MSLRDLASKAVMILEDGEIFTPEWKEEADKLANALRAALAEPQPEIEQLKAERDALLADAERYRYLRNRKKDEVFSKSGPDAGCWIDCEDEQQDLVLLTGDDADATIDAARGEN